MKSIRTKLFVVFSALLIFFILFSLVLNTYFLEKYYILRNESNFVESSEMVRDVYVNDKDKVHELIKNIDRSNGVHIVILTSDMNVEMDSFPSAEDANKLKKFSKSVVAEIEDSRVKLQDDYIYNVNIDPRYETKNLQMITKAGNDSYIVFSKPLGMIGENAKIANDFFMFVGLITIVIGNIFIFFFSKRMVHPIVEISSVAKDISDLKFEKKYITNSEDEIGVLGESINQISIKLDSTIKELRLSNNNLKDDIKEKQKIDNMRKTFVSNVSHELKTPIGIIKGYIEGLKYDVADDELRRDSYLDIIVDETEKMDKLVKELLDLSTIESDVEKDEKSLFNISVLIDDIVEKYKPIFKEHEILYSVKCEDDYFIRANMFRIEQVLINYINNAINHVDENKKIDIVAILDEKYVKVSIFNTGENIEKDDLENIWTSFYKVDKSRSREYGGSGLGLSIVKSIVDEHEGRYGVINNDSGVEFWVELLIIKANEFE
ncbi:MAG: ATP-binding protein [Acidaminobacteraceae bacterium]